MSNKKKVYIFPEQFKKFEEGQIIIASTERFSNEDFVMMIEPYEYGEVSHGGTIVRIKKGGFNDE